MATTSSIARAASRPAPASSVEKSGAFLSRTILRRQLVDAVAERIRAHNYEMRPVLREIFSFGRILFRPGPCALRSRVRCSFWFKLQSLLETSLPSAVVAQNAMRQMGQILFAPPNVKGWDGGKAWISTRHCCFATISPITSSTADAMLPELPAGEQKGADLGFRQNAAAIRAADETRSDRCLQTRSA